MDDKLLKEYQQEATAIYNRRMELMQEKENARGQESIELERRLRILDDMYNDVCFAIRQMVKWNLIIIPANGKEYQNELKGVMGTCVNDVRGMVKVYLL